MTKVFYFKQAPNVGVKVVLDKRGESGCTSCFFQDNLGGCPERRDEREAGSGNCVDERHHYAEVK